MSRVVLFDELPVSFLPLYVPNLVQDAALLDPSGFSTYMTQAV
jgi:hypothetical protein